MKTESKYSLMTLAVIVLIVLNLSTLGTIIYQNHRSSQMACGMGMGKGRGMGMGQNQLEADAVRFSGRYFRDQLNLSAEQMEKFRAFNRNFRPQAREITLALAEKREEMLHEMAATQSDTIRLNTLSDSIGSLHGTLKRITFHYYLNIKGICDGTQQGKLENIFGEMFEGEIGKGNKEKEIKKMK